MDENNTHTRGSLGLAALARGMAALAPQGTQINFQVHHVRDRPRYLLDLLDAEAGEENKGAHDKPSAEFVRKIVRPQTFSQMLCANCNGATVIIGTDIGPLEGALLEGYEGRTALTKVVTEDVDCDRIFKGASRPNPTFLYEDARRFEVLVEIDKNARVRSNLLGIHGRAILEVMHKITTLAAGSSDVPGMPLLSVQCPVQTWFQEPSAGDNSAKWPPPAAAAVRAVYAMSQSTSKRRAAIARDLAAFCDEYGYGLWLGDLRIGSSQGRWFQVVSPEPEKLHSTLNSHKLALGDAEIGLMMPLTLVGPARIGSTHAILSLLRNAVGLGIIGCSITSLSDLAFIHLQLVGTNMEANQESSGEARSTDGQARLFGTELLNLLEGLGFEVAEPHKADQHHDKENPISRINKRAGDYQLLVGPAIDLSIPGVLSEDPPGPYTIWFSWTQYGAGLAIEALKALEKALVQCGLSSDDVPESSANLEYLICRDVGSGRSRAKGKLTFRRMVPTSESYHEFEQTKLCVRLEDAWRSQLVQAGCRGVRDVSVAWREQYL